MSFLGYIIGRGNICIDPAKGSLVTDWPVPYSRKQLQRFLGFTNKLYSRVQHSGSPSHSSHLSQGPLQLFTHS